MMEKISQGATKAVAPTEPFPKEWSAANTSPKEVDVGTQPVTINIDI
jgi:hypothetical protein